MLLVNPEYVVAAVEAESAEDLYSLLQNAIKLEHATIPPYLTAAYSMDSPTNTAIRSMIVAIAEEEMLHMSIVANVLNAIGGKPAIDVPDFIPTYPGPLPMSIGGIFDIGLKKFSKELVLEVFMKIESPEHPISFPVTNMLSKADLNTLVTANLSAFATIGDFYDAVIGKIEDLGDSIFTGDPARQVVDVPGFEPGRLFAITNVNTAVSALKRIIREGEGTSALPFDDDGQPAHFYRFEEIYRGRRLVADSTAPNGFSYSGKKIKFNPDEVFDFPDDTKAADYSEGSEERRKVDAFNLAYSDILRLLQRIFDGAPEEAQVIGATMRGLRNDARDVVETDNPNTGRKCGLTFEYVPSTA